MFTRLPVEVFDQILHESGHDAIKSLSCISRALHSAVASKVWKGICVNLSKGRAGFPLDPEPLTRCAAAVEHATFAARSATHLAFRSELRVRDRWAAEKRCPHRRRTDPRSPFEEEDSKDKALPEAFFSLIAQPAISIVESLHQDQLLSFSWDLGTCIPQDLIEALARKQPRLRACQFTTSPGCPGPLEDWPRPLDLTCFRHLTRISWCGFAAHQLDAVSAIIRINRAHLEELELDFASWYGLLEQRYPNEEPWQRSRLLDILAPADIDDSPGPAFPALRAISLGGAVFGDQTMERLLEVVDFCALQSLTLRKCYRWEDLLADIPACGRPIRLKRLEVKGCDKESGDSELAAFVGCFEGLEDLFVGPVDQKRYRGPDATGFRASAYPLWHAVGRHQATLKRFVYHTRLYVGVCRISDRIDYLSDSNDQGIPELHLPLPVFTHVDEPATNPLAAMDLECIGLSCEPGFLPMLLRPFTAKSTLRVLHLRQTGSDKRRRGSLALDLHRQRSDTDEAPDGLEFHDSWGGKVTWIKKANHAALQGILNRSFRSLVEWAFGPEGIPSLQLIACGDFAYRRNGKHLHNIFVCRNRDTAASSSDGRPYRVFDPRDKEHELEWAPLVRPYWRFLEACPAGPLLGNWVGAYGF